jgi:uncharacterized protein (DUF2141 family)
MQHIIIAFVILFSSTTVVHAQEKIAVNTTVNVSATNIISDKGSIKISLYDKDRFIKKPIQRVETMILNSTYHFKNIEVGEYAIIYYHDKNENNQLYVDEQVVPIENTRVSNNVINFGLPEFKTSKFEVLNKNKNKKFNF